MVRDSLRLFLVGFSALMLGLAGCSSNTPEGPATSPEPVASPSPTEVSEPVPPDVVRQRIELAIEHVRSRQLQTTNSFWTVFHGMLGLGPNVMLVEPRSGQKVNALKYVLGGGQPWGQIRGAQFIPTAEGLDVSIGPVHVGQGHQDQFIGEIAQWGVPKETPVIVFGKEYTLDAFVKGAMARARVGQELSWTNIVIASYVGTDAQWVNRFGEELTFDTLIQSELDASIDQAACGGTHRLFGLTWCYFLHLRNGGDVEAGVWPAVSTKLTEHVARAREYQNPDGSFSAAYFRAPGTTDKLSDRLSSSGHILEWLATYLPPERLKEDWMEEAALAVAMTILDLKDISVESGALYHAIHGLITYHHRRYDEEPAQNPVDHSTDGAVDQTEATDP